MASPGAKSLPQPCGISRDGIGHQPGPRAIDVASPGRRETRRDLLVKDRSSMPTGSPHGEPKPSGTIGRPLYHPWPRAHALEAAGRETRVRASMKLHCACLFSQPVHLHFVTCHFCKRPLGRSAFCASHAKVLHQEEADRRSAFLRFASCHFCTGPTCVLHFASCKLCSHPEERPICRSAFRVVCRHFLARPILHYSRRALRAMFVSKKKPLCRCALLVWCADTSASNRFDILRFAPDESGCRVFVLSMGFAIC